MHDRDVVRVVLGHTTTMTKEIELNRVSVVVVTFILSYLELFFKSFATMDWNFFKSK